ncbi:unnamed protein product [Microthlaspi erraticum]|uniref:Reverse transcriptase domain-containing protein n=1 Tax=Microthlaspi erraticum TaxID=1685480 RepID=A0A6D2K684_9BRAS|nr:unnamed protein product [Microthlaspi erraticum]
MLECCGMIDFPYTGNPLSWVGYRASGKVQCRLDRAIGNEEWHQSFSHTNVEYLKLWGSDHRPVLVNILSKEANIHRNFKFDKRWLGKDGFKETINEGWNMSTEARVGDLHCKVNSCRKAISVWKRTNKSNSAKKIETIKDQLEKAQTDDNVPNEEVLNLKWSLCSAHREEELYWRQKSRVTWLKEGDRNTKFFHASTKQRRARNRITKIKRSDGTWAETDDGIERTATSYFQTLFSSSCPQESDEALRYVTEKVTPEMNRSLTKLPTNEEIKKAISEMNPDKAPGPDGMTSLFYQRFWETMATDVIQMVKDFFTTNSLDTRLNQTNICLIPKTERPRDMSEFRPISLCNVSYKIISKIMSNRLKRWLPKLISETQSAFVARRLITDNILIAQEAFHALRTNPMCKAKFVAIKTDMSKAYDRVEWGFLQTLMLKLGFDAMWVRWIMMCISSVSYQVLINGEAKGHITPSRGLRQGKITGLKIARACPAVSHLLFADDSLFFCKADVLQCAELMKIIECYGLASGQQLNTTKSSIFFGSKVPPDLRVAIKNTIGIRQEGGMGMYLGLPETINGSKRQVFAFVQDRLNKRINSWSAKLKLHSAISNFWWSNKQNSRGIHWIAWEKICLPFDKGGLGFRDLKLFNLALLAKQLWRIIYHPSSLLARILKGRYFRNSTILEVEKSNMPSYGWRSMLAAKDLLKAGLRRTIGTGEKTLVWRDSWIPDEPPRPPQDIGLPRDPLLLVSALIDPVTKEWRLDKLTDILSTEEINLVLSLKPSRTNREDGFCWTLTKSGIYSVKTGYLLATQRKEKPESMQVNQPSVDGLKSRIWSLKTTKKLKHFVWSAIAGCTPVCSKLVERHCDISRACPRCDVENETINHLLFECPWAVQTWSLSEITTSPGIFPCNALFNNLDHLLWRAREGGDTEKALASFPWIVWFIWKARNEKVFEGKDIMPLDTLQQAMAETEAWNVALIVAEALDETQKKDPPILPNQNVVYPRCQVDASWVYETNLFGGALVMDLEADSRVTGSFSNPLVLSPLHAEFHTLIWAMKMVRQMGYTSMRFESDCLQLVTLIEDGEIWPSLVSEFDDFSVIHSLFQTFSLVFIPRSVNLHADALAKEARTRGCSFSHVNTVDPISMVPATNQIGTA